VKAARRAAALGAILTLAGCSTDEPTAADPLVTLDRDIALFAADATGQDIEVMRGPGGPFGLGLTAHPGFFECTDVERLGMTLTRTCTFYDASGAVQAAYDPETTASVVEHAELSGTVDRGDWSASVSRVRDLTVTGLAGSETSLTWNGTGSGTMSRIHQTRDGDQIEMSMTSSETATDVVIPVPHTMNGWPLSGMITTTVSVALAGGRLDGTTHTRDVTTTFDGTQYATVTVNGETFTVDLANRRHAGPHQRRGG